MPARQAGVLGIGCQVVVVTAASTGLGVTDGPGLALAWLTAGTLIGLLIPVLGVAVIAAFNVFYWLPIRGESSRAPS